MQIRCQLGYLMILISNGICQYEGKYVALNKNICHILGRNATLWIISWKTRSFTVPRFGFFFQDSRIRVKQLNLSWWVINAFINGAYIIWTLFSNLRYHHARKSIIYMYVSYYMTHIGDLQCSVYHIHLKCRTCSVWKLIFLTLGKGNSNGSLLEDFILFGFCKLEFIFSTFSLHNGLSMEYVIENLSSWRY